MEKLECKQDVATNVFEIEKQKNISKWINANYLIAAKQEVDSLWYIAKHQALMANTINVDFRYLVELHRNTFYINAADVVDKLNDGKTKRKHQLCEANPIINQLYCYRDQHAAHKDRTFHDNNWNNLMEIVNECKQILNEVLFVCKNVLPDNITLNYVCYDRFLFRVIYDITKEVEDRIEAHKYSCRDINFNKDNTVSKTIFHNIEDKWKIENSTNYAVIVKNGLVYEEGVQERQTSCIRWNVLHGENTWCYPNSEECRKVFMAIKLGHMDVFNVPYNALKWDFEYIKDFQLIEKAGHILVYDVSITDEMIRKSVQRYL